MTREEASTSDNDYGQVVECYENTAVFLVSMFQYLIVAIAMSKGYPHRAPITSNC